MTESTERILLDTNILVYAYDSREPAKHQKAKSILRQSWLKKAHYAISTQSLSEFFVVITKKIGMPVEEAQQIVQDLVAFQNFTILNFNFTTVLQAISFHKKTKVHYYDSLLATPMIQHGVSHIYTENIKDFKAVPGIEATNPLA